MIDLDLAAALDGLASDIARMRPPMNSNPHAFHEDRSELASRARALALRARGVGLAKPSEAADVPAPIGRQATRHETRYIDGRTVLVLAKASIAARAAVQSGKPPADVRDIVAGL